MSALARYFHTSGSIISGSDKETSSLINDLQKEGIKSIWTPHNKENIKNIDPEYVIFSTAVSNTNEELIWAKENKKHVLHRSELLELAHKGKKLIAISGTHGKTTTSAMIYDILYKGNLDPSLILGGIALNKNTNTIIGSGEYFIIEADESDKSFLKGEPEIAIITNIEAEHLENYPDGLEEIKKTFLEFAKKTITKKGLVICLQDKITREIIENNFNLNNPKLISYGIYKKCPQAMVNARYNSSEKAWEIYIKEKLEASIKLKNPAEYNVLNALAAFSAGYLIGINPRKIKEALEGYLGVKRRFQVVAKTKEITIIDDYAHHPTEIAQTIQAAKELNPERLIIVLQPHQPTRLRDLWEEFIEVLKKEENIVFVTDTYIARGTEINGISSQALIQKVNKSNINYLPGDINKIAKYLKNTIKPNDLILIMGAGDITNLGQELLKSY